MSIALHDVPERLAIRRSVWRYVFFRAIFPVTVVFVLLARGALPAFALPLDGMAGAEPAVPPGGTPPTASSAASTGTADTPSVTTDGSALSRIPPSVLWLPNANGELVAVPADATLESYLDWLKQEDRRRQPETVGYSITSLEITGIADDDRATLNIKIIIQLTGDSQPVLVPLGLNELILTRIVPGATGTAIFAGHDREQGYRWWIQGKGVYELQLEGIVPVRKALPLRRLQLALPATAVSHLTVKVPFAGVSPKTSESSTVQTRRTEDNQTLIEVFGLGQRLDLAWQPTAAPGPRDVVLEVNSSLTVRVASDSLVTDAIQRIRPLQGSVETLSVHLPTGAELVAVEGREYREHRTDPQDPAHVTVLLTSPTATLVTLNWTIRQPYSPGREVSVSGFRIDGARKQSGEIGLVPLEGLKISTVEGPESNLLRMPVAEWRSSAGLGQVSRAFRFISQPFDLMIAAEPVQPYFLSEPRMVLQARADELSLNATFDVQVYRGSVSNLVIKWPHWKVDGWLVETVEPRGSLVESFTLGEVGETPGGTSTVDDIQVRLVSARSDRFRVELKARRPIRANAETAFSLPSLIASASLPTDLTVVDAENVESEIRAVGNGSLRSGRSEDVASTIPASLAGLARHDFRLDNAQQELLVRVQPQVQKITVTSQTDIQLEDTVAAVTERLRFEVQYEPVSSVLLQLPEVLVRDVQFRDRDGTPMLPSWGESQGTLQQARLNFDKPRIGQFEIECLYPVVIPTLLQRQSDQEMILPLVTTLDPRPTRRECLLTPARTLTAVALSPGWIDQAAGGGKRRFVSTTDSPLVLKLRQSAGANGQPVISEAWIDHVIDSRGRCRSHAQMKVQGLTSTIHVVLAGAVTPPSFLWNGRSVAAASVVEFPPESGTFVVPAPSDPTLINVLTIAWEQARASVPGNLDRATLHAPQIANARWTGATYWRVYVPGDTHLFSFPSTLTPLFSWEQSGFFWRRVPDSRTLKGPTWVVPEGSTEGLPVTAPTTYHLYPFLQFGAPATVKVIFMATPVLLFLGAGLSLILGFVLLRVRVLHTVFTGLVLLFVVAVLTLWYLPQIELLLQPVLMGIILPAIAVLLEYRHRKRRAETVLTVEPVMELEANPFGNEHARPGSSIHEGPEHDVTQFRQPVFAAGLSSHHEANLP